jgi:alcohol dehydrogenase (NADP+)
VLQLLHPLLHRVARAVRSRPHRARYRGHRGPVITPIAREHGIHPAALCVKWAVQRGQIPILFSGRRAHYLASLRAATSEPLADVEMAAIAATDKNCRLIKGQVFLWPKANGWEDLWDLSGEITSG